MQVVEYGRQKKKRAADAEARAHARSVAEISRENIHKMRTEFAQGTNTINGHFSRTKARKRENKRMGGNETADNKKQRGDGVTELRGGRRAKKGGDE